MGIDVTTSKRSIRTAAEKKLGGKFNVICSKEEFGYISYAKVFCQETTKNLTCYAFRASKK